MNGDEGDRDTDRPFEMSPTKSGFPRCKPSSTRASRAIAGLARASGEACTPAATRPAIWAMSTRSRASTASAMAAMRSKSIARG